jgi:TolB protein
MTIFTSFMGRAALVLAGVLSGVAVRAQGLDIDIINGTASALPIAVVPFGFDGASVPPESNPGEIVRADLARSGQFRTLPKNDIVEFPTRQSEVKFATWRLLKQDWLVIGRMSDGDGGTLRVEWELFDVASQKMHANGTISGQRSGLRDIAHQVADAVYEKILGVRGAFWTRIA